MRSESMILFAIVLSFFLFSFGCILSPQAQGPDYGAQLEALNSQISAASSTSAISNLTTQVKALEEKTPSYPNLLNAQLRTLELINDSIIYAQASGELAKGIDCSKDYSALISSMNGAYSTRQSAISSANSHISNNKNSSASLLVQKAGSIDAQGMGIFAAMLLEQQAYECKKASKPVNAYSLPLNRTEAERLAVKEIIGSQPYFAYSTNRALEKGTVISPNDPSGNAISRTMNSTTWFFMLDSTPQAQWSHLVKYVFIDADTGSYYTSEEESNPQIDGINYWLSEDSRLDKKWIVYPANPEFVNVSLAPKPRELYFHEMAIADIPAGTDCSKGLDCCKGIGKDKALVVDGDDNPLFAKDVQSMYNFLKQSRGMPAGDIIFLTAKADVDESDAQTTLANLKVAISVLARDAQCCDRIFIYITGHGNNATFWEYKNLETGKVSRFNKKAALALDKTKWNYTGNAYQYHHIDVNPYEKETFSDGSVRETGSKDGGIMWSYQLYELFNSLKSCNVTVMYDSCHSGWAVPTIGGKGRTVITTSNQGSSWGFGNSPGGGMWNSFWILAHATFKEEADTDGDGVVSDREAFDFANKQADALVKSNNLSAGGQTGTWTEPEPCSCCHVQCDASTDWKCGVLEGDGANDPRCRKIGDLCTVTENITGGNITENFTNITENITKNITENLTINETGNITENLTVCGTPEIEGKTCTSDSDCPKYWYCGQNCTCRQYPLICGDGHIAAGEQCENDSDCGPGKKCSSCQCINSTAICGNALLEPPEQCEVGIACAEPGFICDNHCACQNVTVTENITTNQTINQTTNQTTNITEQFCGDGKINGNEQCDPNASPTGCYEGVCSAGCICVLPPAPNCTSVCSQTAGTVSFGGGYASAADCANGVKGNYGTKTCFLTCSYAWYYKVSNIAGSASCCCGMKKEFACSDCPGTNPTCPAVSTCTANAPSWFSPP